MTLEENISKFVAKLSLAGIRCEISTDTPDGIPLLESLVFVGDNQLSTYKVDLSKINNGKIRLKRANMVMYSPLDINTLDYSVQDPQELLAMIMYGMLIHINNKELRLNNSKMVQIEETVKQLAFPQPIPLDKPFTKDIEKKYAFQENLINAWLENKSLAYALLKVDSNANERAGNCREFSWAVNNINLHLGSIHKYEEMHDDAYTDSIIKAKQAATESLQADYDLIGNMYDIFEPNSLKRECNEAKQIFRVSPILTHEEQEKYDYYKLKAQQATQSALGISFKKVFNKYRQ